MDKKSLKEIEKDTDGLLTYEYLANNIENCIEEMDFIIGNFEKIDTSGQFVVSAARYLHAVDAENFKDAIERLVALAINKDRERRYLGNLLECLYGTDYTERFDELNANDDNFRRIYKRIYPKGI